MKLSEAILLGSTVVTPKAGALHFSAESAGCALGMAAVASGCTFSPAQRPDLFDHHVMDKKDWTLNQLVAWVEHWEPSELAQDTLIADASLELLSQPQWRDLSDDAGEWQKTREAFEAKVSPKRRRGPRLPLNMAEAFHRLHDVDFRSSVMESPQFLGLKYGRGGEGF